jgi:glucosyl-3-phosphoglycerate synthase
VWSWFKLQEKGKGMILNRLFSEGDGGKMISIIIPVLNESATITSVVQFARRSPLVSEVIVVDDGSIDGTPELAKLAGAKVTTSTMLGKGASMEDGLREARGEILVYLDGDLENLDGKSIERLISPILNDEADFVKAKFTRAAGRVTQLTAKPLIRTYFPELAGFDQPLSGVMAARKSALQGLRFENDYGVDVGLLIGAFLRGARIAEVDIGHLEHRNQSLAALSEMATQVARVLLERAAGAGRLRLSFIHNTKEQERLSRLTLGGFLDRVPLANKVALFDMDGVLLNGRFIVSLAQETNKESDLAALLDNYTLSPGDRMRQIAAVFAGVRRDCFETVAREIPLMPGAAETIIALRKAGYSAGIITDSYFVAAEIVRRRVFADFAFAHLMPFRNGKASGRVQLCPAMLHPNGCAIHDHCKVNVMMHLMERLEIASEQILAVGDGENDICLLKAAGLSVAFRPKSRNVRAAAQFRTHRLGDVPALAGEWTRKSPSLIDDNSHIPELTSN